MIISQTIEKTVTIDDVEFDPEIKPLSKLRIEETGFEKSYKLISDCSTLEGWTGSVQLNDEYSVCGTSHIHAGGSATFNFGYNTLLDGIEYYEFFIRGDLVDYLTVTFYEASGIVVLEKKYHLSDLTWRQIQIPITEKFAYITFRFGAWFHIDMLQAYCLHKEIHELHVDNISTTIKRGVGVSDIELGNPDVFVNDDLQYLEWKFKQIDAVNDI